MGGAAWRGVCRQQHCVVNQMTDAEKKEILRRARATVADRSTQPISRKEDDALEKRGKETQECREPKPDFHYSEPVATLPQKGSRSQTIHAGEPEDNPLTVREQWLLEVVGQEFGERDEKIEDLKREVAQLRQASSAEFASKIERLFAGFCGKLDATVVRFDKLTRSADRREPVDLPPLPLARRVN